MKAILMSIQPKWCELIASGKKTVEVRRTKPRCDVPFKVYMYCTNSKEMLWILRENEREFTPEKIATICAAKDVGGAYKANGKVIGEFVCDNINTIELCREDVIEVGRCERKYVASESACMDYNDFLRYLGSGIGYGYHISDLVIYNKPKELSEFYRKCKNFACEVCEHLKYQSVNSDEYDYDCEFLGGNIPITRPPQSWCYVEEVGQ